MKLRQMVTLSAVAVFVLAGPAFGLLGPSFSLDDDPNNPITSPFVGFGFGAEDPYMIGTYGGSLAPSPSLPLVPAMDADILRPSPAGGPAPILDVPMSVGYDQPFGYLDAVSDNTWQPNQPVARTLHVGFSVDRISVGQAGTAVGWQAGLNQQPGDLFRSVSSYTHPKVFAGFAGPAFGYGGPLPTTATPGSQNDLMFDETWMNLIAGPGSPIPPGLPAEQIRPGTHDNVDAANWTQFDVAPLDGMTDRMLYFSVPPAEGFLSGARAADIYAVPANAPAAAAYLWAPDTSMGLVTESPDFGDNIDGLVVWEVDEIRPANGDPNNPVADPLIDYALFSLSHGSVSLAQYSLNESDVFFTDFTGRFWLYATDSNLGLAGAAGFEPGDNVDALEIIVPGDITLDDVVNVADLGVLAANWATGTTWIAGDVTADQLVNVADLGVVAANWGFHAGGFSGLEGQIGPIVPTPMAAGAGFVLACGLGLMRRRRPA